MDYRTRVLNATTKFKEERGLDNCWSAKDLMECPHPEPKHGDSWGRWTLDARALSLIHSKPEYPIYLDELDTSAKLADVIFQLCSKSWMKPDDLGHLVQALEDLLDPQANICSCGFDRPFNAMEHLKTAVEEIKAEIIEAFGNKVSLI